MADYINQNWQKLSINDWITIIFQILHCLTIIQLEFPSYKNNEFKLRNIHVKIINSEIKYFRYDLKNYIFVVPNINILIKIFTSDFSCIDGIVKNGLMNNSWFNKININKKKNNYYDICFFF